jgi:nucleotide-binding universal stress UspA family protein
MMEIKKLLYASDIVSPDFSDVEGLLDLRNLGLEEILFFRTGEGEDWGKTVESYGLKSRIMKGDISSLSRLGERAREEEVSMIAVNHKEKTKGLFLGSPMSHLLRRTTVPVMVINRNRTERSPTDKGMFYHVIFATDWSPLSEAVLRFLLNFKEMTEMLEIVYVINRKLSIRDMRKLKEKLGDARSRFLDEGIDAEAHVYAGKPAEEIMLAARDYKATSIIMGTSSKSPTKAFFTGSCSYGVAAEAEISTLFIPLP